MKKKSTKKEKTFVEADNTNNSDNAIYVAGDMDNNYDEIDAEIKALDIYLILGGSTGLAFSLPDVTE